MSKIKNKDKSFIEESYLSDFTLEDLKYTSGIKIKNSHNVCFLNRYDKDNMSTYWAECALISGRIKELRILTQEQLLEILNKDKSNYILVK